MFPFYTMGNGKTGPWPRTVEFLIFTDAVLALGGKHLCDKCLEHTEDSESMRGNGTGLCKASPPKKWLF